MVVVTGPTASGKTAIAIDLAEKFDGEIVNADSMQVYRFLDVGTAKPSLEERARVPHHLIDVVRPDEPYSAGLYAEQAHAAADAIHARGRVVFLVGGTGLYIRAFLEGLLPGGGADPELRERFEAEDRAARQAGDPGYLHRQLTARDAETAARIHPNDSRRIVRALELCERATGGASGLRAAQQHEPRFQVLHLALDPGVEALDARIDDRCRAMVGSGLLQEVRRLRRMGFGPELRCMQAIGYRHMQPVVEGSDTLANALEAMCRDTRRFARRQRTWLRAVPDVRWRDPRDRDRIQHGVAGFLAGADRPPSTGG